MVFRRQIKGLAALVFFACMLFAGTSLSGYTVDNTIHEKPCTVIAGHRTITLNIDPKPVKQMKELTFSITVTPCDKLPDKLLLDLSMPGMLMGNNQVTLVKKHPCLYEGNGIIVRCMSRQTLWQVTILSDELNNPTFTFNARE